MYSARATMNSFFHAVNHTNFINHNSGQKINSRCLAHIRDEAKREEALTSKPNITPFLLMVYLSFPCANTVYSNFQVPVETLAAPKIK
jgi:hypothetical protein